MQKKETIVEYLSKFTQVRDELGGVGETVPPSKLMRLTLLGLSKSQHNYQDSVNGRDNITNFERLWYDLMQEEIRRNNKDNFTCRANEEENFSLEGN